jgi:hypothetical protein
MYVILRGKVTALRTDGIHKDIWHQGAILSDGDAFGELTLVDETNPTENNLFVDVRTEYKITKRPHSIKTTQKSILMKISNNIVKDIIQPLSFQKPSNGVKSPQSNSKEVLTSKAMNLDDSLS